MKACLHRVVNSTVLVLPVAKEPVYDQGESSQAHHAGGGYDHEQSSQAEDGGGGGYYDDQSSQGQDGGGGYEPGQSSYAHTDGGSYEPGQSSFAHTKDGGHESAEGSQGTGEDIFSGEVDEDEIHDGWLQDQMEAEDSEGYSDSSYDSAESDQEEIVQPWSSFHDAGIGWSS